ncbi:MAG: SUMF1/EgtB/PvdO family nonheme iron enzyme [Flavobacteriales bacterium]|nr:SUMF1/EgtB/PvdO family nonheme iron enzyme [Flavobacteriales bacterium]
MKNTVKLSFLFAIATLTSCMGTSDWELTGVPGRKPWFHPEPYGTVYIKTGTFHTGQSDQDIFRSYIAPNKQVTIHSMWMDQTEITNNEYRQFVYYVQDSIAHKMLDNIKEIENPDGTSYEVIDYEGELDYTNEDLGDMFYKQKDRYNEAYQIDMRKLVYDYQFVDLVMAANDYGKYYDEKNDRSKYIKKKKVKIYPDTLCWIRDFAYSYNDPMTRVYFYHPKYDDYPVVGVNWHQANAFCDWRTRIMQHHWNEVDMPLTESWRLPTEYEWEYAARGGRDNNMYPWGGPYTRNSKGCFLANFKPNRGDYIGDGGFYPVRSDSYFPNDYGLYNMAGNVAEWTINAYAESSHQFTTDFNPDYRYDAVEEVDGEDYITLSRKVIRGGSWKDIAYFIQNSSRAYEYQDTCKSFIGFRCVQTYIGRSALDTQ